MPVKPIAPSEVTAKKAEVFPDAVMEGINELIALNWSGNSAKFTRKEAACYIAKKMSEQDAAQGYNPADIYKWLSIEDIYAAAGWNVLLDSPGWDESYDSFWVFKKK